jgi:acyl-CoA thioesterase
MTFELDEDTAVALQSNLDEDTAVAPRSNPVEDGALYSGAVSERWTVAGGPNGGYLAGILLRAVIAESPHADPLTMTVHYLARPDVGPCRVHVKALRIGRGHATFRSELEQSGTVRCAGLVTLGRLRDPGPLDFQPAPPPVPVPEESLTVRRIGEDPALWERVETRAVRKEDLFMFRSEPGEAATGGWVRLRDGRPTDAIALALFLDCWPPAVFGRTLEADLVGAPTVEYTVHWRNRPTSDWCYTRLETKAFAGGYVDEHGELWDESGRFVAESRQLARYLGHGSRTEPGKPSRLAPGKQSQAEP